jgi:ribosomal protein S6
MKNYELVCIIDAAVAGKDVDALKTKIEKELDVVATDDMGLLPLAYPLRGQEQAYFVSYHIRIDAEKMAKVSNMLKLEKGIAKYVFFVMKENEAFLKYADLKKSYDTIVEEEEAAKMKDKPVAESDEESQDESEEA